MASMQRHFLSCALIGNLSYSYYCYTQDIIPPDRLWSREFKSIKAI